MNRQPKPTSNASRSSLSFAPNTFCVLQSTQKKAEDARASLKDRALEQEFKIVAENLTKTQTRLKNELKDEKGDLNRLSSLATSANSEVCVIALIFCVCLVCLSVWLAGDRGNGQIWRQRKDQEAANVRNCGFAQGAFALVFAVKSRAS